MIASVGVRVRRGSALQQFLGVQAGLDPLGERDLLLSRQQLRAADAVEVGTYDVGADHDLTVQVGLLVDQLGRNCLRRS